jgi:hypothetical protein
VKILPLLILLILASCSKPVTDECVILTTADFAARGYPHLAPSVARDFCSCTRTAPVAGLSECRVRAEFNLYKATTYQGRVRVAVNSSCDISQDTVGLARSSWFTHFPSQGPYDDVLRVSCVDEIPDDIRDGGKGKILGVYDKDTRSITLLKKYRNRQQLIEVLAHELAHSIGREHSDIPGNLMYPTL